MIIVPSKYYNKLFRKLDAKKQTKATNAIKLFMTKPEASKLRLHQLKGNYYPQYSISAGGDLRIHFHRVSDDKIILMAVGTHSQLYK